METSGDEPESPGEVSTAFADTSIFLNYALKGLERDYTTNLIDEDWIDIVTGVTVVEELAAVEERRRDIYADFLDFVLEDDKEIGEYDPDSRRPYFQENDLTHVRNLQMQLSQLDSRAEIQRQLRRLVRSIERRLTYLQEEVIPERVFDQQPGVGLLIDLGTVIENTKDRNVVADAALWAAECEGASGVFATQDRTDLVTQQAAINEALSEARGTQWILRIVLPQELPEMRPEMD